MKKQLKAGKTDWSDPKLSDEEDDDKGSGEISSDEDEPADGVEEADKDA